MKEYTVQQISKLLKTNPETVRRWIRSGKLSAVQDSRKSGNLVSEEALKKYMYESPKYAGLVATIFAPANLALPIALGSLMGSVMTAIYGQKKTKVTSDYIEGYLCKEIERYEKAVEQKKKTIEQLQTEVLSDEQQLENYKYALHNLDLNTLANEVNNSLRDK